MGEVGQEVVELTGLGVGVHQQTADVAYQPEIMDFVQPRDVQPLYHVVLLYCLS